MEDDQYTIYQEWYEEFIERVQGTYKLEKLCVYLSSVVISTILIVLSILDFVTKEIGFNHGMLIFISGWIGIGFAVITKRTHLSIIERIKSTPLPAPNMPDTTT